MKAFLIWFASLAVIAGLPFLRDYTDNSTLDTLIGLVVYIYLWTILVAGCVVLVFGLESQAEPCRIRSKITQSNGRTFIKLKWTFFHWIKLIVTSSVILGTFIYVDWTGPAVLYIISQALWLTGASMIRKSINTISSQQVDTLRSL